MSQPLSIKNKKSNVSLVEFLIFACNEMTINSFYGHSIHWTSCSIHSIMVNSATQNPNTFLKYISYFYMIVWSEHATLYSSHHVMRDWKQFGNGNLYFLFNSAKANTNIDSSYQNAPRILCGFNCYLLVINFICRCPIFDTFYSRCVCDNYFICDYERYLTMPCHTQSNMIFLQQKNCEAHWICESIV